VLLISAGERRGDFMAKASFIKVAKANVVANPHPEGIYIELFSRAVKNVTREKYRGSDYLIIGRFSAIPELVNLYSGQLFVYTEFDRAGDWLNTQRLSAASKSEVEAIVIPEALKPIFVFSALSLILPTIQWPLRFATGEVNRSHR
jgi:hypothetical protein